MASRETSAKPSCPVSPSPTNLQVESHETLEEVRIVQIWDQVAPNAL